MKKLLLALVMLAVAASTGYAHGGSYRGPAGEIPPGLRKPEDPPPPPDDGTSTPPPEEDGGQITPPDVRRGPGPGGMPPESGPDGGPKPVRPIGPGGDGGGNGPTTGPGKRPAPAGPTYDSWEFWWGYNKDDILNLKARLKSAEQISYTNDGSLGLGEYFGGSKGSVQAPTQLAIQGKIIPALERALADLDLNFDIRAGAVIALAKVGSTQDGFAGPIGARLIEIMNNKRGKQHFSVEESGALALGLLQNKDAEILSALCDKALDDRSNGNRRTRSFALLALGLLQVNKADAGYERVVDTLRTIIKNESKDNNLPVCALTAMGLSGDPAHLESLLAMVKTRKAFNSVKLNDLLRSYAISAMGKILQANPGLVTKECVDTLKSAMTTSRGANAVRSAVIAYGQIGSKSLDRKLAVSMVQTLEYIVKKGENQAANFGLISLGKLAASISDDRIRGRIFDTLRVAMKKGSYTSRPFAALALGLMGRAAGSTGDRDAIREAVRFEFNEYRGDPRNRGGFAIALGMLEDRKAVAPLIKVLEDRSAEKRLRGSCAVALGMIRDRIALKSIRKALTEKTSRDLRVDTAVAAGLIGDSSTVTTLIDILEDPRASLFIQGSVSLALGRIGDRRAIDPLVEMVEDDQVQDLNRALAAVALGLLGDRNDLAVMTRLSKDVNYRASINAMSEVLTIL
jgi:HEAT repeat protein